jgi:hypothetical protein
MARKPQKNSAKKSSQASIEIAKENLVAAWRLMTAGERRASKRSWTGCILQPQANRRRGIVP